MPEGLQGSTQALGLEALLSPPCLGAGRTAQSCPCAACGGAGGVGQGSEGLVVISTSLNLTESPGAALGQRKRNRTDPTAAAAPVLRIIVIKYPQVPRTCPRQEWGQRRTHRSISHLQGQPSPSSRRLEGRSGASGGHFLLHSIAHPPQLPPAPWHPPDFQMSRWACRMSPQAGERWQNCSSDMAHRSFPDSSWKDFPICGSRYWCSVHRIHFCTFPGLQSVGSGGGGG